jgi:SAM-dependent methyltransferase
MIKQANCWAQLRHLVMISYRRWYIDRWLKKNQNAMAGRVLDIGGKKSNPRGEFRPPKENCLRWDYVNIDPSTNPEFLCTGDSIPLENEKIDCALLCEVLEHVEKPLDILRETHRLLRPEGVLLLTMPFLVPVHADPCDFHRWTDSMLKQALLESGFGEISVEPMGGLVPVISDIVRGWTESQYFWNKPVRRKIYRLFVDLTHLLRFVLSPNPPSSRIITTGWGVVAKKTSLG